MFGGSAAIARSLDATKRDEEKNYVSKKKGLNEYNRKKVCVMEVSKRD